MGVFDKRFDELIDRLDVLDERLDTCAGLIEHEWNLMAIAHDRLDKLEDRASEPEPEPEPDSRVVRVRFLEGYSKLYAYRVPADARVGDLVRVKTSTSWDDQYAEIVRLDAGVYSGPVRGVQVLYRREQS